MKYITFKREMARAYAEGRKKMTRRVLKVRKQGGKMGHPEPPWQVEEDGKLYYQDEYGDYHPAEDFCPYGKPGDQLILGTTWAVWAEYDSWKPSDLPIGSQIWSYFDSDEKPEGFGKLRPALFLPNKLRDRMPRETLRIVRVERVQDITVEDIIKEGLVSYLREHDACCDLRDKWIKLWDSINAGRGYSWDSNPWVWVLGW
jgi:hypothetical protein